MGGRGLPCALSGSRAGEDREGPSWSAVPECFYSALSSLCGQGPWGKPAVCPGAQGRPRRGLWLAGLTCQADPTGNGVGLQGPLRDAPPGGEVETRRAGGRARRVEEAPEAPGQDMGRWGPAKMGLWLTLPEVPWWGKEPFLWEDVSQ